jgi:hypothetical protein
MRYWIMDFSDHTIVVDGKEIEGWAALIDSEKGLVAVGLSADLAALVSELTPTH